MWKASRLIFLGDRTGPLLLCGPLPQWRRYMMRVLFKRTPCWLHLDVALELPPMTRFLSNISYDLGGGSWGYAFSSSHPIFVVCLCQMMIPRIRLLSRIRFFFFNFRCLPRFLQYPPPYSVVTLLYVYVYVLFPLTTLISRFPFFILLRGPPVVYYASFGLFVSTTD